MTIKSINWQRNKWKSEIFKFVSSMRSSNSKIFLHWRYENKMRRHVDLLKIIKVLRDYQDFNILLKFTRHYSILSYLFVHIYLYEALSSQQLNVSVKTVTTVSDKSIYRLTRLMRKSHYIISTIRFLINVCNRECQFTVAFSQIMS